MENFYNTYSERLRRSDGEPEKKLLKKLKIALMVWSVSFLITIFWLYIS